jgi:hypothetical protein
MVPVPPEASPERLTAMLRGAGVLEHGRVVDVAIESSRETLISRITRLRLRYDGHDAHVAGEPRAAGVGLVEPPRRIMRAVDDLDCLELLG